MSGCVSHGVQASTTLTAVPLYFLFAAQLGQTTGSMIFWVKSYNIKGKAPVFSVAAINIIPLGVSVCHTRCAPS